MELQTEIGSGAYGNIHTISLDGKKLALKRNISESSVLGSLHELSILARLRGHPLFVQLEEVIYENLISGKKETSEHFHFVLEHCDSDLLEYKITDLKKIILQILLALEFLCFINLGHFDIKPQNILIKSDQVKICDFGISEYCYPHIKNTSGLISPDYRSPEVAAEIFHFTPKSDIWSLGCVIYQLLTGTYLFRVDPSPDIDFKSYTNCINKNIWYDPTEDWIEFGYTPKRKIKFCGDKFQEFDPFYQELLKKMIVINPEKRFSATELIDHFFSDYSDYISEIRGFLVDDSKIIQINGNEIHRFIDNCQEIARQTDVRRIYVARAIDIYLRILDKDLETENNRDFTQNLDKLSRVLIYIAHNIDVVISDPFPWSEFGSFPESEMIEIVELVTKILDYNLYQPTFMEYKKIKIKKFNKILEKMKTINFKGTWKQFLEIM